MAFIRLKQERKKGKIYPYYYFCIRRRSGKKDGGDGKVKSPDKLIGGRLNGQYLAFWLWDGGMSTVDYIEAMIAFQIKERKNILPGLIWQIDWKFKKGKAIAGKLKFRSSPTVDPECPSIDARSSYPRIVRKRLQSEINSTIEAQDKIATYIEGMAANLARHKYFKEAKAKSEANYKEWRADPHRRWEDMDGLWEYAKDYPDQCLETIEICEKYADMAISIYQESIKNLIEYAPPSERERFKAAIIRQTEKLASSPNFLDRYEVTVSPT
jgi:hypothetical protein